MVRIYAIGDVYPRCNLDRIVTKIPFPANSISTTTLSTSILRSTLHSLVDHDTDQRYPSDPHRCCPARSHQLAAAAVPDIGRARREKPANHLQRCAKSSGRCHQGGRRSGGGGAQALGVQASTSLRGSVICERLCGHVDRIGQVLAHECTSSWTRLGQESHSQYPLWAGQVRRS